MDLEHRSEIVVDVPPTYETHTGRPCRQRYLANAPPLPKKVNKGLVALNGVLPGARLINSDNR